MAEEPEPFNMTQFCEDSGEGSNSSIVDCALWGVSKGVVLSRLGYHASVSCPPIGGTPAYKSITNNILLFVHQTPRHFRQKRRSNYFSLIANNKNLDKGCLSTSGIPETSNAHH